MNAHSVVRFGGLVTALVTAACASGGGGRATMGGAATTPAAVASEPPSRPGVVAGVDSLGAAVATTAVETARDQKALDSLHSRPGEAIVPAAVPAVPSEEVEREAEQLFGAEGRALTFDIDVTSFAAHRRVLEYLHFFQVDARDRFAIWLSRLGRYEGMIRSRLRAKGLPEDLVYLTLIESGLSNTAVSRAKAVGMWQFMASTGRVYGLTIDPWMDERRDPFKATDAAVNHLADLVEQLGSVYLAAAAYNAGAGKVVRGIGRLPGDVPDSLTDHVFFQLAEQRYLKRETRDYVPKLIAAALIAKEPLRYGFTDIALMTPLMFDEVLVADATGLDVMARLADTTVAAVLELNPQFVRGVTPPGRSVTVRVPRGSGELVAGRYADLPVTERVTFVDHYIARGETLSEVARRYHVSQSMILAANPRLKPHSLRVGQRVIVPMSGRIVPPSAWSTPPEVTVRRIAGVTGAASSYRVRSGDTASGIARQFGVSLTALLNANGMTVTSIIRPGDRLRIPSKSPVARE
jgi:membrane-bound lytic murein transglycosylase D